MSTFKKVSKWNEKCGKQPVAAGSQLYYDTILDQLKRIAEELNETIEAANGKDLLELIDGGLDLDVVVAGLNYLIGADYDTGIARILANNDLKVTKSIKKANSWLMFHQDNGTDAYVCGTVIGSQTFYCVKRTEDEKILKYGNFPKVDLTDLVPELAVEVYLLVGSADNLSEDVRVYATSTGMSVVAADKLPEGSPEVEVFGNILEEAESGAAFLYLVNGVPQHAENFTVDGPGAESDEDAFESAEDREKDDAEFDASTNNDDGGDE